MKKKRIHFISIGGAVMHNLAIALKNAGHEVSGSDDEIYDPARSRLESHGILPSREGWFSENIHEGIDLILLGMHARKGNPELDRAVELGLKINSFPEFIYHHAVDKTRVVVGGSHGKTTTTAMIMHALKEAGSDFDYLVGAYLDGFENMVKLSDAPIMVIEGDEYLSSALDRRPKFLHYKPQISVLTGIAWDHMNVFPTEENYNRQFADYLQTLEDGSRVFYFENDAVLGGIVQQKGGNLNTIPYGEVEYEKGDEHWWVLDSEKNKYPVKIFGSHNMANLSAAQKICNALGIDERAFFHSMRNFLGAKKRLQLINHQNGRYFYQDFAHAPSKVKATVNSFRERFPDGDLCVVVELHTFSSLNQEFLPQYRDSLKGASNAIVFFSPHTLKMKRMPPLSSDIIKKHFGRSDIEVVNNAEELRTTLHALNGSNTHFLLMSSGTFGGTDLKVLSEELL